MERLKDYDEINFGNSLTIVDKANETQTSYFNLHKSSSYYNKMYKNNRKSYQKLTGSEC